MATNVAVPEGFVFPESTILASGETAEKAEYALFQWLSGVEARLKRCGKVTG
jgi:hypothetical protein